MNKLKSLKCREIIDANNKTGNARIDRKYII